MLPERSRALQGIPLRSAACPSHHGHLPARIPCVSAARTRPRSGSAPGCGATLKGTSTSSGHPVGRPSPVDSIPAPRRFPNGHYNASVQTQRQERHPARRTRARIRRRTRLPLQHARTARRCGTSAALRQQDTLIHRSARGHRSLCQLPRRIKPESRAAFVHVDSR